MGAGRQKERPTRPAALVHEGERLGLHGRADHFVDEGVEPGVKIDALKAREKLQMKARQRLGVEFASVVVGVQAVGLGQNRRRVDPCVLGDPARPQVARIEGQQGVVEVEYG